MTHAHSITATAFDSNAWSVTCKQIEKDAAVKSSGSELFYLEEISTRVQLVVADLPKEHRAQAFSIARRDWHYQSAFEIRKLVAKHMALGCCKHLFAIGSCPFGC